jgi:hypothetical protein
MLHDHMLALVQKRATPNHKDCCICLVFSIQNLIDVSKYAIGVVELACQGLTQTVFCHCRPSEYLDVFYSAVTP